MAMLYDSSSNIALGEISDESLRFLVEHLEEEGVEDRDFYINKPTVEMLADEGAPQDLLAVLNTTLANRPDIDIRYGAPSAE